MHNLKRHLLRKTRPLDRIELDGHFYGSHMRQRWSMLCFVKTRSQVLDHLSDISGRRHHAGLGSSAGDTNNDPDIVVANRKMLRLPGVSGNDVSTPDSAAISVGGDFELKFFGTLDGSGALASKDDLATQRTFYWLYTLGSDVFSVRVNNAANNASQFVVSDATGLDTSVPRFYRLTYKEDNGDSNSDFTFYFGDSAAGPWTQIGAVKNGGSVLVGLFDGTADLVFGSQANHAAQALTGLILRGMLLDGIDGTVVFDWDPSDIQSPYLTDTEDSANAATVTINQSGTGELARIVGQRSTGAWHDTDAYFEIDNEDKPENLDTNTVAQVNTSTWLTNGANSLERVVFADEGIPDLIVAGQAIKTGFKVTFEDNSGLLSKFAWAIEDEVHAHSTHMYFPAGTANPSSAASKTTGYASSTEASGNLPDLTLKDAWQRTESGSITPDAGDLSGQWFMQVIGLTASDVVYITGNQFETGAAQTPYRNGDFPDAYWTGTKGISTSIRRVDLDLAPDESGAWFHVGRTYDTTPAVTEVLIGKKNGTGVGAGTQLLNVTGGVTAYTKMTDGTTGSVSEAGTKAVGRLFVDAGRRDVAADLITAFLDGEPAPTPTVDTTTVTLVNDEPVRAGADGGTPSNFQQGETYAFGFVNNHEFAAWTDSEMKQIEQFLLAGSR